MRNGPIEGFQAGGLYDQTTERAYNDARYMPKDLDVTTITDPAGNAAVSTAIIDAYGGNIITLTGAGNAQTLQSPTTTSAIKRFIVVANDTNGVNTIVVNGITLSAGEAQWFIWDGSAWITITAIDAGDLTFTPAGNLVAVNVQDAIEELDTEKVGTGDSRLSDDRDPNNHAPNHTDGTDDIQSATNAQKGLATASQITALEANTTKTTNANHTGEVAGSTTLTITNKQTLSAISPVTISNAPTVIAGAAPVIAIPTATNAIAGHATAAHIQAIETNSGKTGVTTQISNVSEDTTPTLGGRLEINEKDLLIDITLTDDHSWTGPVQLITAGETLAIFETAYLKSDGKYWKIDASAVATATGKIVMATAEISADATGIALLHSPLSFIRDDSTSEWTVTAAGDVMFLSTTAGELTNDVSGYTTGDIVRVCGYMETATVLNFNVDKTFIEVS